MVWVLVSVVLLLLVFSTRFRTWLIASVARFRKPALWLLAFVVLASAAGHMYSEYEKRESLKRIALSDVSFDGIGLRHEFGSYHIVGRVINNSSKYTLTGVGLRVLIRDCPKASAAQDCVTIGDTREYVYVTVPAGQARDFDESLYFSGDAFNLKGDLAWDYTLEYTKGE